MQRSVNQTLQKYNIKKTPYQIIKEYYDTKGEDISDKEIQTLEKNYRQNEPEQFLAMYDAIRENPKNKEYELVFFKKLRCNWNLNKWCSTFTYN